MTRNPEKLLILLEGNIPTVEIILRCLQTVSPPFHEIRMMLLSEIEYPLLFSNEYKILFIRTCNPAWRPLLGLLSKYRIHYAYYLDDNFWELKTHSVLSQCYQHPTVINTLNQFIHCANQILVSSLELAEYISERHVPTKVKYVKAGFDFSLISDFSESERHATHASKINILYAGSLYRDEDFKEVSPALQRIAKEYTDSIRLYFYGYLPIELSSLPQVHYDKTFFKYSDYIQKQYLGRFDIGLAPLADTISNRCKSDLKYREYGACHIAGIYTNMMPYRKCIVHKKNGLLVNQTRQSWYEAIKLLIEDVNLRNNIQQAAYEDVKINFSTTSVSQAWSEALYALPPNKKIKISFILRVHTTFWNRFYLLRHLLRRALVYFQKNGFIYTSKKILAYLLE